MMIDNPSNTLYAAQGVDPWIEVDGGVTPANAYKVLYF